MEELVQQAKGFTMSDQELKPKRDLATVQLGPEQSARLDIIAERYGVSRAQAARWIMDSVDPLTFAPLGRTISTIELIQEGAPV